MVDLIARVVRRFATDPRLKYPDGRLIPQPGDTVYQTFGGMFGLPTTLKGVVSRSGKTVKVTGGASPLGVLPIGRVIKLGPSWTVEDDPSIRAREEARERAKAEEKAQEAQKKALAEQAVQDLVQHRHLKPVTGPEGLKKGDKLLTISPNLYGDPEKPYVEEVTLDVARDKHIETSENRTYPYTGLYKAP